MRDEFAQQQQAQATYFADRDELAVREQRARELNKLLPPDSEEDAFLSSCSPRRTPPASTSRGTPRKKRSRRTSTRRCR